MILAPVRAAISTVMGFTPPIVEFMVSVPMVLTSGTRVLTSAACWQVQS